MTGARCWALLSGGKDSVCTAHTLAGQGRLAGCIFVDTGIGAPDTRPFVERLCAEMDWPLRVHSAPRTYEAIVRKYGFPKGPRGHRIAFGYLKERAIIAAWREIRGTAVLASGVRKAESDRRSRSVAGSFRNREHGYVIEAPISEMTTPEVWDYVHTNGLPVSPAYNSIGISGDCLCGAFSQKGEAAAIRSAYPQIADRVRALEEDIAGTFRYPRDRWGGYRTRGGFRALEGRTTLESFVCTNDCRRPE